MLIFVVFGVFCVVRAKRAKKSPFREESGHTRIHIYKERAHVRVKNYRAGVKGGMFLRR